MTDKSSSLDQRKAGLQDDHDPREPEHRKNDRPKGAAAQPADKKRAQTSALEGPAAYAPHEDEDLKAVGAKKQKADTPPDADSMGGGSQGGM